MIRNAGHPFSQLLCTNPPAIVHKVIAQRLGQVVLSLMLEDLDVDSALGTLELLIGDLGGVHYKV
jgi:hypothetical protein